MNTRAKNFFLNLRYAVSANLITLAISLILNIFVPRYLGVTEYSLWQLFIFYSSYGALLHFGWLDGIYLKIGGKEYNEIDKENLGIQFWYLIFLEIFISTFLIIIIITSDIDDKRKIIFFFAVISIIVTTIRTFLMYIFQATNMIKEYAQIARTDRYIYAIVIIFYLFLDGNNFAFLILIDIISKSIVMLWGLSKIADIVKVRLIFSKNEILNAFENIKIGSSVMLGNYAGMLIIGTVRFLIERVWSIETFGKLSFTLSISNMFMMFINAAGVVMYPVLRRTQEEKLPIIYENIRNIFVPFTFLLLVFFFPIKLFLSSWLPMYSESLIFMGILFPMVIYEGRTSLLVSTYLKTIREERIIAIANIGAILFAITGSMISVFIIRNLIVTVLIIMISLMLRCIIAEVLLFDRYHLELKITVVLEIILTIVFITGNIYFSSLISFILYLATYILYIALNFKKMINSVKYMKKLLM